MSAESKLQAQAALLETQIAEQAEAPQRTLTEAFIISKLGQVEVENRALKTTATLSGSTEYEAGASPTTPTGGLILGFDNNGNVRAIA